MASRAYGGQVSSGEIDLMPLYRLVGVVNHSSAVKYSSRFSSVRNTCEFEKNRAVLRNRKCQSFQLSFNRMLGLDVQECVMIELLLLESEWVRNWQL